MTAVVTELRREVRHFIAFVEELQIIGHPDAGAFCDGHLERREALEHTAPDEQRRGPAPVVVSPAKQRVFFVLKVLPEISGNLPGVVPDWNSSAEIENKKGDLPP